MVVLFAILVILMSAPLLLLLSVALGPLVLGIICGLGFGLAVFVIANFVVGVGLVGRSLERAGSRYILHARVRRRET